MEIFADRIVFNNIPGRGVSAEIFLKTYWRLAGNLTFLSLLGDGDVSDLPRIQASLEGTFMEDGVDEASVAKYRNFIDVRKICSDTLGPDLFSLLRWSDD